MPKRTYNDSTETDLKIRRRNIYQSLNIKQILTELDPNYWFIYKVVEKFRKN